MFDSLAADLRFAARALRKNPAFSAIAIATLALGIGANTAVFSLVDAVILRPLAYRDADRLFVVHEVVPKFSHIAPMIPVNAMHFREWRKSLRSVEQMALIGGITLNLSGAGEPERLPAARVTPALFPMLGVQAQLGRAFLAEEDQPGRDRVVVLNDELWRGRFNADPGVIGRKVTLDGQPYEIVGVLPPRFHFPKLSQLYAMTVAEESPRLWKPFAARDKELEPMGDFNFVCIARLRPGVAPSEALSELNVEQARLAAGFPEKIELRAALVPLRDQITGRSRAGLQLMLAAVAAVLLIGCVNIANLLLARAAARRREIAIRCAVGASAGRLVRQGLVESLLLAAIGGALGAALAYGAVGIIVAHAPVDLPRMDEVRPDVRLLLFTAGISTLAGLFFGLFPAWRFARTDPQEAMKSGARGTTAGRSGGRLRSLLVGLEVAVSAMCLIAGGLLLRSFVKLVGVDAGFEAQHVVTVDLSLPGSRYPRSKERVAFVRALLEGVQPLPGVTSAGISNRLPLTGEGGNNLIGLEGANLPLMERPLADIREVNPAYFRTMGIPLRAGRLFGEADRDRHLALVSAMTAARLWHGADPIGKRFRIGGDDSPLLEVAGVVGDIRGVSLNKAPSLTIYVPYWELFYSEVSLAVRTAMEPGAATSEIRGVIRRLDTELPVPAFRTMQDIVAASVAQRRFQMSLVLFFAAAALLLAGLGIYGVVSYAVTQRTNEMGIRLALGARPQRIRGMVMMQALRPVAAGLVAGAAASLVLGRLLSTLLFGVSPRDPATVAGVVAVLAAVAVAAGYIPARRATRVDPASALRCE